MVNSIPAGADDLLYNLHGVVSILMNCIASLFFFYKIMLVLAAFIVLEINLYQNLFYRSSVRIV